MNFEFLPAPMKNAMRRVAGRFWLRERLWHVLYSRQRAAYRRLENAEVARISATVKELPSASVAVIMPTYKRPETLRRAVRSVLDQTVKDLIVVVVDNAGGQVEDLPDDPRVVVYRVQKDNGSPGLARNVGIRLSRSQYIAFLDDDDTFRPDHLEHAIKAIDGGSALVYTAARRVRADGTEMDVLGRPFDRREHADDAWVDICTVVGRRSPELRFDPWARPKGLYPAEDWELVHRMSARFRVEYVPVITVDYLVHDGSYFSEWTDEHLGTSP